MDGESVPDHMYRMAMLAMTLPFTPEGVDRNRAMQMCLVHDVAEVYVGDITPECGISSTEKKRMETAAMHEITALLPPEQTRMMLGLFEEYEEGVTETARFVKDLDKIEFLLQARSYENRHGKSFPEFFSNTVGKIQNKTLLYFFFPPTSFN